MEMLLESNTEDAEETRPLRHSLHGGTKHISDLEYMLQQRALFTSNIHLADQKSGYIALLHGVLITGIASVLQNNEIIFKLNRDVDKVFYIITVLMLFLSFVANMLAFIPRVRRSAATDNSWTDMANGDVDVIVKSISAESYFDRTKRIAYQAKTLAKICNDKFSYIKYSIILLAISMATSIVLFLRVVLM